LLHHHEHDKPLSEAERDRLLSEGETTRGMVSRCEPSEADRRNSVVRVEVNFKGGQRVEFTQELASLYQPAPGSPEARRLAELRAAQQVRHPDRIPKIQLPLSGGQMVPVRYDASDRTRLVIDVAALQQRALRDYIKQEQQPKTEQNPKQQNAAAGPPWVVPVHCPNCGAPVDQATASRAADPHCQFCSQPIPVTPR
jgi:hypothetical protein